jgi:hypothetical protein
LVVEDAVSISDDDRVEAVGAANLGLFKAV